VWTAKGLAKLFGAGVLYGHGGSDYGASTISCNCILAVSYYLNLPFWPAWQASGGVDLIAPGQPEDEECVMFVTDSEACRVSIGELLCSHHTLHHEVECRTQKILRTMSKPA
jgi:hypothetical protein